MTPIFIKLDLTFPDINIRTEQLLNKGYNIIALEDNKTLVLRKYTN